MTVLTSPAEGDPPAVGNLIAAAQHLGQTVVADSLTPPAGSVAERLVLSAVVLGAAERQMLDIQNELARAGSQRQALSDAVRVTAEVACGDHPGPRCLWLTCPGLNVWNGPMGDATGVRLDMGAGTSSACICQVVPAVPPK